MAVTPLSAGALEILDAVGLVAAQRDAGLAADRVGRHDSLLLIGQIHAAKFQRALHRNRIVVIDVGEPFIE